MSQNRETATDRLVSIIQLIQLGRRTGILTARRGEGAAREEGSITFSKGQVTRASVGRRTGADALNVLTTWGNCRFIFLSSEEADTGPFLQISPPPERTSNTGPIPRQLPPSPAPGRVTGPLASNNGFSKAQQNGHTSAIPLAPYRIRPLTTSLHTIENLGLSRYHKRLLILIDGQRSVAELARLMGKSEREIVQLLQDLERTSTIQVPGRGRFP